MGLAHERHDVMLAVAVNLDVADQDQLVVALDLRERLREVVARIAGRATVLGSGDLFSAQDVLAMLGRTGVDGVTVARGAIGNPCIFGQVRDLLAGREPQTAYLARLRERPAFKRAEAEPTQPSPAS